MRISVLGLGYVGSVSAACLANDDHHVIGVDPNPIKVGQVNQGVTPVVEPELGSLISSAVIAGTLRATTDPTEAVLASDLSLVCVGTPSRDDGSLDLDSIESVCEQIGSALAQKDGFHVVAIRSTVLPGTTRRVVTPALERASGGTAGRDFGVAHNPEFLRESTAVRDYFNPPKTVVGVVDDVTGKTFEALYDRIEAPFFKTSVEIAEMVKYVDNAWHALKVAYGNEIGNVCKELDIDSHKVIDIFCRDTKLNISPAYLRPGFAFGGSCLPKDLRALTHEARRLGLDVPLLDSILPSNQRQIARGVEIITRNARKRVGCLGISFKSGTDDIRESPLVEVIRQLIGWGYDVRVFDPNVDIAKLTGANRDYILSAIPEIAALMVDDIADVLSHGEVIVIGNNEPLFRDLPQQLDSKQTLVDLVRVAAADDLAAGYEGINW